jgi:hypothetical protein
MRAKTILTVLFLVSICVAAFAILHALPQRVDPASTTGPGRATGIKPAW